MAAAAPAIRPHEGVNVALIHRWSFIDSRKTPQENPGYEGEPGETNNLLVKHALAQTRCRVHIVHGQLGDVYGELARRGELVAHDGRQLRLRPIVNIDSPADLARITATPAVDSDELLVLVLRKPWTKATKRWQHLAIGAKERQPGMVRHSSAEVNKQAALLMRFLAGKFGTDSQRLMVVGVPPQLGRLEHDLRERGFLVSHPHGIDHKGTIEYDDRLYEAWTTTEGRTSSYEFGMYLVETKGRHLLRAISSLFSQGTVSTAPPEFTSASQASSARGAADR